MNGDKYIKPYQWMERLKFRSNKNKSSLAPLHHIIGLSLILVSLVFPFRADAEVSLLEEINLSATQGQYLHYTFEVPEGSSHLNVLLTAGVGDPDLYVRFGSQPTVSEYDCRPYEDGTTDEVCDFTNPQAGTWYVMVHAYADFSGSNLTANITADSSGGGSGTVLDEANLSATQGQYLHYTFEVPEGSSHLNVLLTAGVGDPDLYVRFGSQPTVSEYDCRPYEDGTTDEVCDFTNPQAGTWYVMVHAYADFSGSNLTANITAADGGIAVPSITASTYSRLLDTSVRIEATTTENNGTLFLVLDTSSNISGITAAQVKAGNNNADTAAIASNNVTVSDLTPYQDLTGLTASTAYSVAMVHSNVDGDSNVEILTFTSNPTGFLLFSDFNNRSTGSYAAADVRHDFQVDMLENWTGNGEYDFEISYIDIVTDPTGGDRGNVMRVKRLANEMWVGEGHGGMSFRADFTKNEDVYLAYDIYLEPGHYFVKIAKNPGLLTGNQLEASHAAPGQYADPEGLVAFSATVSIEGNLAFGRGDGSANTYTYDAVNVMHQEFWDLDDPGFTIPDWTDTTYGGNQYLVPVGRWISIMLRVKMNSVIEEGVSGHRDGLQEVWVGDPTLWEGWKKVSSHYHTWRWTETMGIDGISMATYYGGEDTSEGVNKPYFDQYHYYDNFRVSTNPIPYGESQ